MIQPFYLRYYSGHKGRFGHEFLEFEIREDGRVRYANNSNYKSDLMIRKEVYVGGLVVEEIKSDEKWPAADRDGKQELEITGENGETVMLTTAKIGSMSEVNSSRDPQGLQTFYYLVQDLKCLLFSLINLHFRVKPV